MTRKRFFPAWIVFMYISIYIHTMYIYTNLHLCIFFGHQIRLFNCYWFYLFTAQYIYLWTLKLLYQSTTYINQIYSRKIRSRKFIFVCAIGNHALMPIKAGSLVSSVFKVSITYVSIDMDSISNFLI
jgi:hypothetical protein